MSLKDGKTASQTIEADPKATEIKKNRDKLFELHRKGRTLILSTAVGPPVSLDKIKEELEKLHVEAKEERKWFLDYDKQGMDKGFEQVFDSALEEVSLVVNDLKEMVDHVDKAAP